MSDNPLLPPGWPIVSLATANAALTAQGSPFETAEVEINGRRTRIWKNGPQTVVDVFKTARSHGARIFLVLEDDRVSYEAFARAALAVANDLIARGLRKGDRVALVMRNLPEWPVAFFGAALAGAIVTPLNAWWTAEELEFALADAGCKVAFVDDERYRRVAEIRSNCPALTDIVVARAAIHHPDTRAVETIIGPPNTWASLSDQPMPPISILPEDPASILYTSGTTGKPKGALQSHRNSVCNVLIAQYGAARNFIRRGEPIPAPDPSIQRATLLSVPLFHTTGCHAIMCPTMVGGSKLVLMRRWDAEAGMQLIERERVTLVGGVPTIAWQIIEHPNRDKYDLSSLEGVSYGGAPAASELVRRIKQVFPKSAPGLGWGMTETTGAVAAHSAEDYINRPDSSGPPAPVDELQIVDDAWNALPTGSIGELIVKGPNVVAGYWNRPEANATQFKDGWFRTGDLAKLDEEGFLTIVDRKKDMLIRGGENIYCIEVEDALYRHDAVMDAAVVGIPHRILGEEPGAVVALKHGADASEAELQAFVASHLANFKVPVRILVYTEPLARNANGKILKTELKRLFV
jgi:long-chain acyl-CoA synthetase